MRFKLDENVDIRVAPVLAAADHDVETAYEEGLAGEPDEVVGSAATREGRLLVTLDRGFGDIRRYPPGSHAGVISFAFTGSRCAPRLPRSNFFSTMRGLRA